MRTQKFMHKRIYILVILAFFAVNISVNDIYAQKMPKQKSTKISKRYKTKEAKYEAAKAFYTKGAYLSAAQLFEEVYPLYITSPEAENILFLFASSYMKNHDYQMAAFHFKDYLRRYPQSHRTEEACFLAAKCYYMNSPDYNLDQSDSHLAIEDLEVFLNSFPGSQFNEEANAMVDSLRNKLAKKDFKIACMYYNTGSYQAAQVSFNNLFKDYPYSPFTEEALLYLVKNNYEYAQKSIESKKLLRYQLTIDTKNKLRAHNAESKFLPEAEKLAAEAQKKIDKLLENNKVN